MPIKGPMSPEHRAKISAALKGRKCSPEAIAKGAAARRGKKLDLSPEQRQAMRERQLGRKMSAETKAKISASNRGRKLTVMDRVRRSLLAIQQDRGEKLNAYLEAHPEVGAARIAKVRESLKRANAARALILASPSIDEIKREFWSRLPAGTGLILRRYAKGSTA